jgi:hypothetical protein
VRTARVEGGFEMAQIPRAKEMMSFIIVGGTDAPGWRLVPDGKGGWKLERVPGWNPEQMLELSSVLEVVSAAGRIKNAQVSKSILNSAAKLASAEIGNILGGAAAKGGVVAVIVAR